MKLLKVGLRFWITLASVFSFIGGWIMLVHAPKPDQSTSLNQALASAPPTLEPLPPMGSLPSGNDTLQNQSLFTFQPPLRSQSRSTFRTGGS
jgi:hypothetical protein